MDFRKKIEEKGLKQKWIAEKLDVSETLLSLFLSDDRSLPEAKKEALKEILA